MWSFAAWLADMEDDFWKAHSEVMNATGFRRVLDTFADSNEISGSFFSHILAEAKDFYRAVNWSEPFFRCLAAFHIFMWVATLYSARGSVSDERLIAVCVALTCAVLAGIALNNLGSRYASSIFVEPDVNYFSEDYLFIAVVYMAPLVALIIALQIRIVCRVVKLMVQVKRAQVRRKLRSEAKLKSDAADASPETKKQQ
ncbi:hypothetical protein ABL78_6361 [Leptomonas seymouri]|uniref:Uncharacterized protein n=1 Tax=Leptomonas seymouri TaxID=5684 RepID=A0A0N1IIZ0_LEPSE|nr:hypothetical protein ABL78_6361 [Leptomonas seymouri]|eukprot:KPI84600.1 hypothetical protein ABL78_6361 [Leptomonas seymouri]